MVPAEKTAAAQLATPVQFLKGVGPQRAELLAKLGLQTARDVLFFFPRTYEDLTDQRRVDELEEGKLQSVSGTVADIDIRSTHAGGCVLGVLVAAPTGHVRAMWFNQPYMLERFTFGQRVMIAGKPKMNGLVWEMVHPRVETLADDEEPPAGKILPVYPLTEGLQQWHMRKIVRETLDAHVPLLDEVFPEDFLRQHRLLPLAEALPQVHFPESHERLAAARRRLVYQELFILQLAISVKRRQQHDLRRAPSLEVTPQIDARIRRLFPFNLTASQEQAIKEIAADLCQPLPMNRLLQGDVGSGKTVVAVYAMLAAVAHGYQAVLMAPTEVLARQHAQTLDRLLTASKVRRASLTGGLTAKQRGALLDEIAAGRVDLVVGTQAIIQDDVEFARLGLVVIDEQHKFGVRQRAVLRTAGANTPLSGHRTAVGGRGVGGEGRGEPSNDNDPHYLVMTATPIPRTMTMTLFGDLDVSTLSDTPPGRQKVNTYLAGEDKRSQWWEFFRKKLREGRQGFVVAPLVEESDQFAAVSLEETYERLANGELDAFRLGLIHGRMSADEKDAAMAAFRCGETQVLVSTSVVEVGVDVPNATLMTIESGERFGLAQLHQLRGRISRGKFPGFCCVFASPQSDEARERLDAFVSTTDGFRLAEIDFKLRGPGELFGTRQHGMPPLRIADLTRDSELLDEARRDALALVAADPGLAQPEHGLLRKMMLTRYGRVLELGDVG